LTEVDISRARRWVLVSISPLALIVAMTSPLLAAIHPGDTLYVRVWNHPELSQQVVVDSNGTVRVPLSGAVTVGGLEEPAAEAKLALALRPYVVYPAVNVQTISQGSNLFVAGGPGGVLKYAAGETFSAAVADALQSTPANPQAINDSGQNLTKAEDAAATIRARIDMHHIKVQRDGNFVGTYNMDALAASGDAGPVLQPGDTIVFEYKPISVRVSGDVAHPGLTYLSADQSLSEAITQTGGLLPTSVSNHVQLKRAGTTRLLALGDPAFAAAAQSGDEIAVPKAPRVNVMGTVANPGVVTLRLDSTLLSALYTAGGPLKPANLKDIQLVRDGTTTTYDVTKLTHGDMSQNPPLQDGDMVMVPMGHKIDWSNVIGVLGGVAAGLASRVP
jgi:protein involved in polysaccharide export with SLBB domain